MTTFKEIVETSHKGLLDQYPIEVLEKLTDYLTEGNSKEDLALLYLEALGIQGTDELVKEVYSGKGEE